jgi:hypothetical protein
MYDDVLYPDIFSDRKCQQIYVDAHFAQGVGYMSYSYRRATIFVKWLRRHNKHSGSMDMSVHGWKHPGMAIECLSDDGVPRGKRCPPTAGFEA